jgi:FdhD protein
MAWVIQATAAQMHPIPGAPRLTDSTFAPLRDVSAVDEQGEPRPLCVPVERPLTVCVDGRELVTLMTLGARPEFLVLGYLLNQRLISDVAMIESVAVDWTAGSAEVTLRSGAAGAARAAGAAGVAGTGFVGPACGLGTVFPELMTMNGAPTVPRVESARVSRSTVLEVLETMRSHDAIHRAAGSVHSCGLFKGTQLLVAIEDISRHNGMDTVAGWMALYGVPGGDKILFTTGRLTGEMVMKAVHNGIPVMVSRNGVTSMGCDLAAKLGVTLIGRAANRRFLCYVGAERVDGEGEGG